MRRISCADTAKKCARFCHRTRLESIRRRYASLTSAVVCSGWPGRSPADVAMCEPVQLVVHQRHQPIQRLLVSLIPGQQQLCDLLRHGAMHSATEAGGQTREIFETT